MFVRATVGLARWARISPALVAATLAAFATSSPELTVSVNAALSGVPQIALGDSLGSNVVNVALILGLVLLVGPIPATRPAITRDFLVALLVPVSTLLVLFDGTISRIEGLALLALFALWLTAVIRESLRQRRLASEPSVRPALTFALFVLVLGLALLVAAGRLIVDAASGIASDLGVSQFAVGAIVVAVGTSVPELATSVIAKLRGHDEVSLGTILGSNIFNGLLIVGVASAITPIPISIGQTIPALVSGCVAVALTYPTRNGLIPRWRGATLLASYVAYLVALLT